MAHFPDKFSLYQTFLELTLEAPIDPQATVKIGGLEVVEALWPLNEVFRPNFERIRSMPYDKTFEGAADAAIIDAVQNDWPPAWAEIAADTWRVLLERHQQALRVAVANAAAKKKMMGVPAGIAGESLTKAAMIYMLYQMNLPWPPEDRSSLQLPPGSGTASIRLH